SRGANFVHTMLKLFEGEDPVRVVDDQVMSPTWAGWLAEVLLDLGRMECEDGEQSRIVHASCAGATTWYEFACEIWTLSQKGREEEVEKKVIPVPSREMPRPAKRPPYSVFDCSLLERLLGRPRIPWRTGLTEHLKELKLYKGEAT